MKLRTLGLLSLTMAVCLSSALVAQEEGRGRGRGGPGGGQGGPGGPGGGRGPGGFGGGGFSMGGALDLVGLLRMEEVQKEVELSADAAQAVSEAIREAMPDMRELFSASAEERAAKLKEPNAKAQELLDEVLAPDKQKRLMGLYAQQAGIRAVVNELIAKEIGLDEAGIAKVKEVTTKAATSMREVRESGDFTKMREMMESLPKETEKAILDVLTDEQEKALEALKGEKFAFPEPRFGRGGPGGGPGGPGGPGGGGRGGRSRPGSDN